MPHLPCLFGPYAPAEAQTVAERLTVIGYRAVAAGTTVYTDATVNVVTRVETCLGIAMPIISRPPYGANHF